MAVLGSFPGIKVEIVVNGEPLQEYRDTGHEEPSRTIMTRFVEAKSGEEFQIRYTLTRPYPKYDVLVQAYIDGKYMRGAIATREKHFYALSYTYAMEGALHGSGTNWFIQKFCFSELTISDSESRKMDDSLMKTLKEIGEISVKAHYIKVKNDLKDGLKKQETATTGIIPEKALKGRALSHQASVKKSEPISTQSVVNIDYINPREVPFATFNFKYRSRSALKALCIIPRSPSPAPLEERDPNDLTREEAIELLKRQRERQDAELAVKRENMKKERSEVKRERSDRDSNTITDDDELSFVSAKRRRVEGVTINEDGIETIDLT